MADPVARPVNNPLIDPPALPYGAPPLDAVGSQHFLPALHFALAEARENFDAIRFSTAPPSFANTVKALEYCDQRLGHVLSVFSHFAGSHKTPELDAIEQEMYGEAARFGMEVWQDAALFERVKAVKTTPSLFDALEPDQKVLLKKQYDGFVDAGAELSPESRARMKEIAERLEELTTSFSDNTVKSTAAWQRVVTDEAELAGVPDSAKARFAARAEKKGLSGQWLIPLSPPPVEIGQYAENRALREEVYRASSNIAHGGEFDNQEKIFEILSLRREMAGIMGYPTYADFVLKDRMLETPAAVNALLDANAAAYKPAFDREVEAVKAYAEKKDSLAPAEFKPWDYGFYARRLKEETFDIDFEAVKDYFKLENVVRGAHALGEELFGVKLVETSGKYPVNNPEIKVLEVQDPAGAVVGLMYTDYYARPGLKRNGAWMSEFRDGGEDAQGVSHPPIVKNECNYATPTPERPTLLSLDETTTVFHEFGHALHALLTKARYPSLAGTRVKRDFVEVPSQFLENYVLEPRLLDIYATHHKTGERIPEALVDKIERLQTFDAGYSGLRQTLFGQLDMAWHTADPEAAKAGGVAAFEAEVVRKNGSFPREGGLISTAFTHIFSGGYAVGYYGYKNAEVIEAAMMEKMRASGDVFDKTLAAKLRHGIYGQGGMREPGELTREFLGAAPDPAALFRREGLVPPLVVPKGPGI